MRLNLLGKGRTRTPSERARHSGSRRRAEAALWRAAKVRGLAQSEPSRIVPSFLLLALLLAFPTLSCAQACLQWIKRTDVGSYGQRWQHAMAYDSDRGVTVFFGGEIGKEGEETCFDDTQEYDGKQWKQISTPIKPPPRSGHMMAYDPVRKRVVMFGGVRKYLNDLGAPSIHYYADTWIYRSEGFWEEQPQARVLPSANNAGMVWDSFNKVVLLHLWNSNTWTWNGTNWLNLMLPGPALGGFGMAFDSDRATAMIVGGFTGPNATTADVWEKPSGAGWQYRGIGPSTRAQLAMAYHERRKRVMMVGGVGQSVETGETAYEYVPGTGWFSIPSLPSGQGRAGANMVYDSKRGCMVLTGGAVGGAPNAGSGGRYSDTWELWPTLFISGQPSDVTNEVCTTATFSSGAQGNPPLQFAWFRDGKTVPADERYIGADTAELRILSVRHSDAGKYQLVVRDSCDPPNVVTSRVATLTTRPESEWIFRTTNGPQPRFGHSMVYDRARHVTVLFGGRTNHNATFPFNDLWEWNGARWTQRVEDSISNGWVFVPTIGWRLSLTNGPVRRAHFAMAYDSRRGRTIIFGGSGRTPDGSGPTLRDLWEWDGERWHFRTTNGPVGRVNGSMVYDERRGRTVLFGGQSIEPGSPADTHLVWEWDGERWYTNAPAVLPPTGFYVGIARMTFDSFRGVSVFGPIQDTYGLWSFYEWDGVSWTNNAAVLYLSDPVLTTMNGTFQGAFAFDSSRRRSVWFGGYQSAPQNRTALFDGKQWTLLTNSPPPRPRGESAMAYDSDRRVLVMFGGSLVTAGALGATNDTWELAAVDAPVIHEHPASQIRLAGETATFRASATGHGFVAYQWYFQNNLVVGAQTDTLTIPSVGTNNVGEYFVRVGSECGSATSHVAVLTLDQKLQLFSSANSRTLIWPSISNLVLESATVVTGRWTAVPNASSPFAIGTHEPVKFFRLREVE